MPPRCWDSCTPIPPKRASTSNTVPIQNTESIYIYMAAISLALETHGEVRAWRAPWGPRPRKVARGAVALVLHATACSIDICGAFKMLKLQKEVPIAAAAGGLPLCLPQRKLSLLRATTQTSAVSLSSIVSEVAATSATGAKADLLHCQMLQGPLLLLLMWQQHVGLQLSLE